MKAAASGLDALRAKNAKCRKHPLHLLTLACRVLMQVHIPHNDKKRAKPRRHGSRSSAPRLTRVSNSACDIWTDVSVKRKEQLELQSVEG